VYQVLQVCHYFLTILPLIRILYRHSRHSKSFRQQRQSMIRLATFLNTRVVGLLNDRYSKTELNSNRRFCSLQCGLPVHVMLTNTRISLIDISNVSNNAIFVLSMMILCRIYSSHTGNIFSHSCRLSASNWKSTRLATRLKSFLNSMQYYMQLFFYPSHAMWYKSNSK
jgi:membrane-associated HD superfamily phosphohydrolase